MIGFGSKDEEAEKAPEVELGDLLMQVTTDDLLKFGMIPEFVGRLPVITTLRPLGQDQLIRICLEPKNAIIRQYKKFFEMEGASLEVPDDVLEILARKALDRGTGARGVRSILEEVMLDVLFELPGRKDVGTFVLTKDMVEGKASAFSTPSPEPDKKKKVAVSRKRSRKSSRQAS